MCTHFFISVGPGTDDVLVKYAVLHVFGRSVMLDRAETVLHDHYAGKDYWNVSVILCV